MGGWNKHCLSVALTCEAGIVWLRQIDAWFECQLDKGRVSADDGAANDFPPLSLGKSSRLD